MADSCFLAGTPSLKRQIRTRGGWPQGRRVLFEAGVCVNRPACADLPLVVVSVSATVVPTLASALFAQQKLRSEVRAVRVPRITIGLFKLTVGCRGAAASVLASLARHLACTIEDLME